METSFHYALYRPIITALQAQGQSCTLVINDRVFKPFLDEMLETLKSIDDPQLKGMRLSEMQAHGQRVKCLVSPYHTPALNGLSTLNIRAMYGLAKETWNHADWNRFYLRICVTATTASGRWHISAAQKWSAIRASTPGITARSTALCRKTSNPITVNLRCSTPPRLAH